MNNANRHGTTDAGTTARKIATQSEPVLKSEADILNATDEELAAATNEELATAFTDAIRTETRRKLRQEIDRRRMAKELAKPFNPRVDISADAQLFGNEFSSGFGLSRQFWD
jgi:hypothetical protein